MDGERVHAAAKLGGERGIDHAMAFDPALSAEGFRHDIESEMGLAAGSMAGVALVPVGFIFHVQTFRRESFAQLFRDEIACRHCGLVARIARKRNPRCGAEKIERVSMSIPDWAWHNPRCGISLPSTRPAAFAAVKS
jgi:hypothetical protein